MIVRILGEGQFRVDEQRLGALNELDNQLESAIDAGDQAGLRSALEALQQAVRDHGEVVADDELVDSDLIVPDAEASLDEVREMLDEDGLIPG